MNKLLSKKAIFFILSISIATSAGASSQEDKDWVNQANSAATESFKNSSPDTVPNYDPNYSVSESDATMTQDATEAAQTDEAAQLIYSLGTKPDVADQSWYKDASKITDDPGTVISNESDGEYSDCKTSTTPGETYTKEQSCTETELTKTSTCTTNQQIEVDSHYRYECQKKRDTTTEDCAVGRKIDIAESAKYQCDVGETSYVKTCNRKKVVVVNKKCNSGILQNGVCVSHVNECRYDGKNYVYQLIQAPGSPSNVFWNSSLVYSGPESGSSGSGYTKGALMKVSWTISGHRIVVLRLHQVCRSGSTTTSPEVTVTDSWEESCDSQ